MTKKKRIFRIASLLFVLCMISTVMISGTFAKYTSEYAGQDTALVARWSFTGNFDGSDVNSYLGELPIWDHDYSTNIYENDGTNYLIAPGIQGEFIVNFSYDADVDANLTFNFTKSGNAATKVPIQYSIDNFTTVYYSLDDLEDAIIYTSTNATISGPGSGTYVITDTSVGGSAVAEAVGTGDGSTSIFNLAQTPNTGTLIVKLDGTATEAYTLDGKTITFTNPPDDEALIIADYVYAHTAVNISKTVSWRWPYDVSAHNTLTSATTGVAADRDDAEFPGTGDFIEFVAGTPTAYKEWTDTDDTLIGNASNVTNRDSYILYLQIKAEQIEPSL